MLTDGEGRAAEIAAELDRVNRERREIELEVLAGAERGARSELRSDSARPPAWCSPARAGIRGWSGSSLRAWSSATTARWS